MRLNRLDLWRYGKFTDFTLEFGDNQPDQPDLHIVYGPNEAGKSTLMAAYLDLLFGYERTPKYKFQHGNALKVGAALLIDNEAKEYRRLKKNKDSLVDSNDQPISEDVLKKQLAGLGKQSYENMFSLNDVTLEKGGESILASEGDLGKLLYSATTGVAQLSDALQQMRSETEAFYQQGKRKFELADLKAELKNIESQRKAIDTEANAYSKLVKIRDEAESRYSELGTQQDALKLQLKSLQLIKSAYPRLTSLERLETDILPFRDLPDTPETWLDDVRKNRDDKIRIDNTEKLLTTSLNELEDALNQIELDDAALTAMHLWKQINAERERYQVANANLPDQLRQAKQIDTEIADCLRSLDRPDTEQPKTLILTAATQATIKNLLTQQPALLTQINAAEQELSTAEALYEECKSRFVLQGGSTDIASDNNAMQSGNALIVELELAIAAFSDNDLSVRYRQCQRQRDTLDGELSAKISTLSPWMGDAKILLAIATPHPSELQSLQRLRDDLASRMKDENIAIRQLKTKLADLQSQHKSFGATGLIDDAKSLQLRKQRDEAWQHHRNALDLKTADVFEQAMRSDDASQTTRLQHTESLAQLTQLSRESLITEEALRRHESTLSKLITEQQSLNAKLAQLISNISPQLNPAMSIEAVNSWLDSRAETLEVFKQLSIAERELASIETQSQAACATISRSLEQANVIVTTSSQPELSVDKLNSLMKIANSAIKHETALSGLREQLLSTQYQLDTRKKTLKKLQTALELWASDWQDACKTCWLGSGITVPSASTVEGVLQQLALLEKLLTGRTELSGKAVQNKQAVAAFEQLQLELAEALSLAVEDKTPNQLYQALHARMTKAVDDQKKHEDLLLQKTKLLRERKLGEENQALVQSSIESKLTHFTVNTLKDVEIKLQEVATKRELQKQIKHERNALLDALQVKSLFEANEYLVGFDSDAAQIQLNELERLESDLGRQLEEAHTVRNNAREAVDAVGGDEAVALLNESRANLLLTIEDKITRFMQQHVALNAADAALKVYRDKHRSSMMTTASDAFATISHGRYSRLETLQDGTSEQLIAIEKNGASKMSDEMSKGTRFQLYLALRVAGYHEYTKSNPSLPFVADDIMETADDERAMQTFQVLGEMALVGQVIYLTHHKHLCDIAKQAVPGCLIHELPTTQSSSAS